MRKRGFLIESLVICIMGVLGVFEGVKLLDKVQIKSEAIGPSWYLIFISAIILMCGLIYVIKEKAKCAKEKGDPDGEETGGEHFFLSAGGIIIPAGVFTGYILLLPIFGYTISTLVFLVFAQKTFGEKSWIRCVLISTVLTAVFYIGFIRVGEVALP